MAIPTIAPEIVPALQSVSASVMETGDGANVFNSTDSPCLNIRSCAPSCI